MEETPRGNGKVVFGPGNTDQLVCSLPHEDKKNPRFAPTLLNFYLFIYLRFGAEFK
jgi:hypothetical protein